MKKITLLLCTLWLGMSAIAQVPPPPPPPPPPIPPNQPTREVAVVHFTSGSWVCDEGAKVILDKVALKLRQDSDMIASIIGYTNCLGTDSYNRDLSQKRANAAKEYLVTRHGIDPSRMTTEGRGSAEAISDCCNDKTVCGIDRRAVIRIESE